MGILVVTAGVAWSATGCTPIDDVIRDDVARCIRNGGGVVADDAELIFTDRGEPLAFVGEVVASDELLAACFGRDD